MRKVYRQPRTVLALLPAAGLFLAGCGPSAPMATSTARRPSEGVVVALSVPAGGGGDELAGRARAWATRTGATLTIVGTGTSPLSGDAAILSPGDLGDFAARGELAAVPDAARQGGHPLQWLRILPPYRNGLGQWGREFVALPVAGDAPVLVYRKDRFGDPAFRDKYRQLAGRDPAPPATWADFADLARHARAAQGAPSLPPLPAEPAGLLRLFHLVAAAHDREALTEGVAGRGKAAEGAGGTEADLSFHFDLGTGLPRLTAPGFVAAAEWLRATMPSRMATGPAGPAAALAEGSAVCGVVSLGELGRLTQTAPAGRHFGVARVPGSSMAFTPEGKPVPLTAANFVPYFGSDARLGVVRKGSPSADAAWEMIADLAGVQGALAGLANPRAGAAPFRSEQIEEGRTQVWYGYDFDDAGTKELATAARNFAALEVSNPVIAPRLPGHAGLMAILAEQVGRAARGEAEPKAALEAANRAWAERTAAVPEFRATLRKSAGLE